MVVMGILRKHLHRVLGMPLTFYSNNDIIQEKGL